MRKRWGWTPRSQDPRNENERNPRRRGAGRFYRLGVERLEDRHMLNAGPLSIVGDVANSLIPMTSDVQSSHGSDDTHGNGNHGNSAAVDQQSDQSGSADVSISALQSITSQTGGSDHSDNGLHLGQLKNLGSGLNNVVSSSLSISLGNGDSRGPDHSDNGLSPAQGISQGPPAGNTAASTGISASLPPSLEPGDDDDDDSSYLQVSAIQTVAVGNTVVTSEVTIEDGPNRPPSATVNITVDTEEPPASYPPGNWETAASNSANSRPLSGQTLLVRMDGSSPPSAASADTRTAPSYADTNRYRSEREYAPPDLSSLAMTASKIETHEAAVATGEDFRQAASSAAAIFASYTAPVTLPPGSREIELVALAMSEMYGIHFLIAGVDEGLVNAALPMAGDETPVDQDENVANVDEVTPLDHLAIVKGSWLESGAVSASLLDSMPVDFQAVDQALNELLGEIESLGGDLSAWLDVSTVSPWKLAAGAAVATGVGGLWLRRTRLRRARQQQLDEESTSWLFSQSHGLATGTTL